MGREVRCLVDDINAEHAQFQIEGFVVTDKRGEQAAVDGLPVFGADFFDRSRPGLSAAIGVGHPAVRLRLRRFLDGKVLFPDLVHPSTIRSSRIRFPDDGCLITAGNILTTSVSLGVQSLVNLRCTLTHDVVVGAFSVLAPGVHLSGHVTVGEGVAVGTGAVVIEGRSIGSWSVVGAGSVVTRDVPDNATAVGIPARVIKTRDAGWHLTDRRC